MKQKLTLLFCILVLGSQNIVLADGVNFLKGSWKEAVAAAKKANKLLFVEGYTDHCGSCQMMARDVFPDAKVGAFMNANFISYQMNVDGSNEEASQLFYKFGGYYTPGLFFVDPKDESLVYASGGGRDADYFIQTAQTALDMPATKAKYQSGKMSQDEKIAFWTDISSMPNNPFAADVAAYLASQPENKLSEENNYYLMTYYIKSPDSREFKYYLSHADEFMDKYSEDAANLLNNVFQAVYMDGLQKNNKQMVLSFTDNFSKFQKVLPSDFNLENFKKEVKQGLDQQLGN